MGEDVQQVVIPENRSCGFPLGFRLIACRNGNLAVLGKKHSVLADGSSFNE